MENYRKFENGEEIWIDHKGREIPKKNIKDLDIYRDGMVRSLIAEAVKLQDTIKDFKIKTAKTIDEYLTLMATSYGGKANAKGNYALDTFDKTQRVQVCNQSFLDFDTVKLGVAKGLIDECIRSWSHGANSNLKVLVDDAFKVDKKGQIDKQRILSLLQYKIDDDTWKEAMEAIKDSIQTANKKAYIRFWFKDEKSLEEKKYKGVILDFAAV